MAHLNRQNGNVQWGSFRSAALSQKNTFTWRQKIKKSTNLVRRILILLPNLSMNKDIFEFKNKNMATILPPANKWLLLYYSKICQSLEIIINLGKLTILTFLDDIDIFRIFQFLSFFDFAFAFRFLNGRMTVTNSPNSTRSEFFLCVEFAQYSYGYFWSFETFESR